MSNNDNRYQLEQARAYWRHAPSGRGKHDTTELSRVDDATLLATWDDAFRSRFRGYPEEDRFARTLGDSVRGERILSIGSGLGFHEVYYQSRGARLTCVDIVPSNLRVIERVTGLKGLPAIRTIVSGETDLSSAGECDTLFIYGSLMAMPRPKQRELLAESTKLLSPAGRLILMLYTWTFVSATCGWDSPEQFDPLVFARASDPSVGSEDCPWSDWHDDEAVLDLAGGAFGISKKQFWNRDYYVWYELTRRSPDAPKLFFDQADRSGEMIAHTISGADFAPVAAVREGTRFVTEVGHYEYAAKAPSFESGPGPHPNAVDVAIELKGGAISVGLLDQRLDVFVTSGVISAVGASRLRLHASPIPETCQIVVSNHHDGEAGASEFEVARADFVITDLIEPPQAQTR